MTLPHSVVDSQYLYLVLLCVICHAVNISSIPLTFHSIKNITDSRDQFKSTSPGNIELENAERTVDGKSPISTNSPTGSMHHGSVSKTESILMAPNSLANNFRVEDKEWVMTSLMSLMERVTMLESRNSFERLATLKLQDSDKPSDNWLTEFPITAATCAGPRRHLIGESCYSLPLVSPKHELLSWWDSRYFCKSHLGNAADLVAVETHEEFRRVVYMLQTHFGGMEEIWLGASNLTNTWTWIASGSPLSPDLKTRSSLVSNNGALEIIDSFHQYLSTKTDQGSADGSKVGESRCLSLQQDYTLAAEPCYFKRYPLCELNLGLK